MYFICQLANRLLILAVVFASESYSHRGFSPVRSEVLEFFQPFERFSAGLQAMASSENR
jgi:hypothetical protein